MLKLTLPLLILVATVQSPGGAVIPIPDSAYHSVPQALSEQVPILLYHHLAPEPETGNPAVVTVSEFRQQMEDLKAGGWQSITTAELSAWLSGQGELPANPFMITFDDGYRSNWEYAYPILSELEFQATLFLVTSKVGTQPGRYPYVTWADLWEMQESQVFEIQAHTHDGHHELEGRPALITWDGAAVKQDLARLQTELTSHELRPSSAYAYPYGAYDEESIAALTVGGMKLGFTGEPGYVRRGDDPYRLKRLSIWPGLSPCRFMALVSDEPKTCHK